MDFLEIPDSYMKKIQKDKKTKINTSRHLTGIKTTTFQMGSFFKFKTCNIYFVVFAIKAFPESGLESFCQREINGEILPSCPELFSKSTKF